MRMDRYKEVDETKKISDEENKVLSREAKNQDMYKDVYMNNTVVDINSIFNQEQNDEVEVTDEIKENEVSYQEKSYNVNEYLEKAREMHKSDDAKRNLEDQDFIQGENEIKKLIADIEEREQEEDFFSDLRGDDENTLVGAKMKTAEFDTDIFNTLVEDDDQKSNYSLELERVLGEQTVYKLQADEEQKLDHTFEKIIDSDRKINHKINKLPKIIFFITLALLIVVIIIILLIK